MSLNDFRKEQKTQGYANLGRTRQITVFDLILTKVVQYAGLTLIGWLCWNYLAPLFNLPVLSFLRILALILLSEIFFLRGSGK